MIFGLLPISAHTLRKESPRQEFTLMDPIQPNEDHIHQHIVIYLLSIPELLTLNSVPSPNTQSVTKIVKKIQDLTSRPSAPNSTQSDNTDFLKERLKELDTIEEETLYEAKKALRNFYHILLQAHEAQPDPSTLLTLLTRIPEDWEQFKHLLTAQEQEEIQKEIEAAKSTFASQKTNDRSALVTIPIHLSKTNKELCDSFVQFFNGHGLIQQADFKIEKNSEDFEIYDPNEKQTRLIFREKSQEIQIKADWSKNPHSQLLQKTLEAIENPIINIKMACETKEDVEQLIAIIEKFQKIQPKTPFNLKEISIKADVLTNNPALDISTLTQHGWIHPHSTPSITPPSLSNGLNRNHHPHTPRSSLSP